MEVGLLPVVADVNKACIGGVDEHCTCLGRLARGDALILLSPSTFLVVDIEHGLTGLLLPGLELIIQVENVDAAFISDEEVLEVREHGH